MMHAEAALAKSKVVKPTDEFDFSGRWINELKSYMDLAVNDSQISGTYTSLTSSTGEPVCAAIIGTISGDLISFIVNWDIGAITAWTGHHVDTENGPMILTLWQMVSAVPDETNPENQWKMIQAGADEFTR
jgi:hypothetical protein